MAERTPSNTMAAINPVQVVWPALEAEFGWTKAFGQRPNDIYYLPMGIQRGQNGARCRVDYYDSHRQVS